MASEFATTMMDATFKLFNAKSTSTCFLIQGENADGTIYVVSTAHTFQNMEGETAILVLREENEDGSYKRLDHKIAVREDGKPLWVKHESQDVAVLKLAPELPTVVPALPIKSLASAEQLQQANVQVCDQVFIFTYPERFEANRSGLPVARQGIFSSPPQLPSDRYPTYLAEFTTFSGDSGGPVFIPANGKQPLIVGMVTGSYNHDEKIESKFERRLLKHPFHLGIVLHTRYLIETIHEAEEKE